MLQLGIDSLIIMLNLNCFVFNFGLGKKGDSCTMISRFLIVYFHEKPLYNVCRTETLKEHELWNGLSKIFKNLDP